MYWGWPAGQSQGNIKKVEEILRTVKEIWRKLKRYEDNWRNMKKHKKYEEPYMHKKYERR